jgi:hypothetical protein
VAHEGVSAPRANRFAFGLTVVLLAGGCAAGAPVVAPASADRPSPVASFPDDDRALRRFRSVRFHLSIPLPDGEGWRIDDHSHRELVATHAATRSKLVVYSFLEPELMNRRLCEARARELGLVPQGELRTVEDGPTVGPDGYDTRVWVALQPGRAPGAPLGGHVFAFGAFVRKCFVFHYASEVGSDVDDAVLSSRLATARLRILRGIVVEPFDEPPREKPQ